MNKQLHDLTVTYLYHSPKAILISLDGEEHWLPFSEVEMTDNPEELNRGQEIEVTVPDWLAVKKGMV